MSRPNPPHPVTGVCERNWAGAGRRVMSGGEYGPCAPGEWAMPEGAREFQGWWVRQKFKAEFLLKAFSFVSVIFSSS
jgi:hypothetical protein